MRHSGSLIYQGIVDGRHSLTVETQWAWGEGKSAEQLARSLRLFGDLDLVGPQRCPQRQHPVDRFALRHR